MRRHASIRYHTLAALTVFACLAAAFGPAPLRPTPPTLAGPAAPEGQQPPNIVLVLADDLDARLGTLDYTPYIRDLLQHQGLTFDNALVPVSLCCPSRVPKTPRSGWTVCVATSRCTSWMDSPRALATRSTCPSALAGLMCGSNPLPDDVTASAGTGAFAAKPF